MMSRKTNGTRVVLNTNIGSFCVPEEVPLVYMEVTTVLGGIDAIEKIKQRPPAVVVLDLRGGNAWARGAPSR